MRHRLLLPITALLALTILIASAPASLAAPALAPHEVRLPIIGNSSPGIAPNDPLFASGQWNMAAINAWHAWTLSTGSADVLVAVIDTGIDGQHPEFDWRRLPGRAFLSSTNCEQRDDPGDDDHDPGHGTHVAGIIGAEGNNGQGMAGLAWQTRLLPVKALDCAGKGQISDIVQGIDWAVDQGADVINLSVGWKCSTDESVAQAAITRAYEAGVVVVAAAGNYGSNSVICPAALNHVVSVAATTIIGQVASYSSTNAYVDVAAPGGSSGSTTGVLSTLPTDLLSGTSEYGRLQGTSQAAPHVAGVAALLLARNPYLDPDQIEAIVESTATDLAPPGRDNYSGAGLLEAARAVAAANTSPALLQSLPEAGPRGVTPAASEYRPGVVLVQWQPDAPTAERAALLARVGATSEQQANNLEVVRVAVGSEQAAQQILRQSLLVAGTSLDMIAQLVE